MFKTSRLERAGFAARLSVVMARNGMVATSQPLATGAGVAILKKGGNAFDAAIATALTLGVVEPMSTNIGGDAFLLYRWAADDKIYGVNGSGRCPQNLTLEALRRQGIQGIPRYGWGSVTVPGAIDAFVEVQRRHGKLTFAEVLEPAIYYASEGFPVSEIIAQQWQAAVPVLSQFPTSAQTYLVDGKAPQAGMCIANPIWHARCNCLRQRARRLYQGDIARRIVQFSQATGAFDPGRLASHTTEWVERCALTTVATGPRTAPNGRASRR
jgi:gamma-glutamyltranspeptidase/glutathione hydrolase